MDWLAGIGLFVFVGMYSYFDIKHHPDSRADRPSQDNEGDRQDTDTQIEAA